MKTDIVMPKLGESITEGTIVKWWKQPGDFVKKDETLLEISTDKVDSEIPSPFEGVLVELKAGADDVVEVDSVIAVIDTDAAAGSSPAPAAPEPATAPAPTPAAAAPAASSGNGSGEVIDFEMPKLGESITEGTIVKWWKQPGDSVKKDETILEISTDKVDSEIPSPFEGTIAELMAQENDVVEVGSVIARIQVGSSAAPAPASASTAAAPAASAVATTPAPSVSANDGNNHIPARQNGGRFYSPLVRSIARTENVTTTELERIPGSGLNGRVTKDDILGYLQSGRVAPTAPAAPAPQPAAAPAPQPTAAPASPKPVPTPKPAAPAPADIAAKYAGQQVDIIPMDNIRKKIADHMVMSKSTSPHVYGVAECDFTHAMTLVKKRRPDFKEKHGMKLTINPMILYAAAKAVSDFPDINSSIEGHTVIRKRFVNLGMAVATKQGLIVPTLKNADQLNFLGVAKNAYDLAIRARDKKLTLPDVQGATLTVTNYGVFGNIIGFPIINQPNVAILGVGAIKKRPVVIETESGDMIGIRSIGYLTLSYDHRLVDGELGDQYLQRVVHYLQNFDESWL